MCSKYLIEVLIELVSSVIVAFVTSYIIDYRLQKRLHNKSKIREYYIFLLSLQNKKVCETLDLEQKLKEMDLFFSKKRYVKNKIYMKFNNVYKDIMNILRYKDDQQLVISNNNEDLQQLLNALRVNIKEEIWKTS